MHRLYAPLVAPLIEALEPRVIVETGSGSGRLTRKVLEAPAARHARLHAIDPAPSLDPRLVEEAGERIEVHAERAVGVVGRLAPVDLALLDGDPNWYSVHTELKMLSAAAERAERPPPLVVVHNVHWPFGRRDGYYDPAAIPAAQRHRHSESGLVPGRRDPCAEGLKLAPHCAIKDFEPRSGVLTAVEDMVAESELDWTVAEIPGFHGCAVLAEAGLIAERPAVARVLEGFRDTRFLGGQVRRAETARLEVAVELEATRGASVAEPEAAELEPEAVEPQPAVELEPEIEPTVEPEPEPEPEPSPAPALSDDELLEAQEAVRALESERLTLLAELADHRAQREAFEWRMGRLEDDLNERDTRIGTLEGERDEERVGLLEVRLRLEQTTERLAAEQAEASRLKQGLTELEGRFEASGRELREVTEREQLAQGKLSHREEALQATNADAGMLRAEVERLRDEVLAARALLDEIGQQLDRGAASRWSRFGRRVGRIARAATFRGARPADPYELAQIAAQRGLPESTPTGESEVTGVDPPERPGVDVRSHR